MAVIEGDTVLWTRGVNETITLNASRSYDPEVGLGNYTGINFHWFCEALLSPSRKCPVLSNSSSDNVVNFHTGKVQMEELYKIRLVIRKDTRNATAVQMIRIVSVYPPKLSIR